MAPKKKAKKTPEKKSESHKTKKIDVKNVNYWALSTFILAAVLIITLLGSNISGAAISSKAAGQKVIDFASNQGAEATLISVEDEGSLYAVTVSIEGQQVPVYITKDGKSLIPQTVPLDEAQPTVTTQTQEPTVQQYTQEDLQKLEEFNTCLAENGVQIYGANWCGWTKKWVVETLGGFDTAAPVYVECTENQELCTSEEVTGYPTTKINGEVYSGARTIEAIASETGCAAPELEGSAIAEPSAQQAQAAQC